LVVGNAQHERRSSLRTPTVGRHRGVDVVDNFSSGFRALAHLAYAGARVSANVLDLRTDRTLVSIDDHVALPTAGIGTVLLLVEVAARIGQLDSAGYRVLVKPADGVEPGLWSRLQAPALPVFDLAMLIGATGDSLATNVLLHQVGLGAVRSRTVSLGLTSTALLDFVRRSRGPDDAPHQSVGSAAELARLFAQLARGLVVDAATSNRVLTWLANGVDGSMVASAFGLDPLERNSNPHGVTVVNKTGTEAGLRSEVGLLFGPRTSIAYAVTVQFDDSALSSRLRVLDAMRTVGYDLLEYVH
jgi:beta-lactamase class A